VIVRLKHWPENLRQRL